jgi:hypothetical protein
MIWLYFAMVGKMVVDANKMWKIKNMVSRSFYYHKIFQKNISSFYYHMHYHSHFEPCTQPYGRDARFLIPKWNLVTSNFF